MKKIILILFPIKLQLTVLQLEDYNPARFIRWLAHHFFKRDVNAKRPLKPTLRVKAIIVISSFLALALPVIVFLITRNTFCSLISFVILITQPYVLLIISSLLLKPYEIAKTKTAIIKNRKLILSNPKLKVIAITGSFGKSSVKEIIYQMIKSTRKTIRAPESFNTILGIDKFLKYEFDSSYEYFICEMAAYNKGDIKQMCHMIPPTYGVLTGITKQHLERFGNLRNIVLTKFELFDSLQDTENMIFNHANQIIKKELQNRRIKYNRMVKIQGVKFGKNGSSFQITIGGKKHKVHTSLFGMSQVKNIQIAAEVALKIGLKPAEILKQIALLTPPPSRSVLKTLGNCSIVDNTFSSNIESFLETIETAKKIDGKKTLVTPGIVELGKDEISVHRRLGKKIGKVFKEIVLVGRNPRTHALAKSLDKSVITKFIKDDHGIYKKTITKLAETYDWIFLENDITQNY